jgi:tripartite-type tricarboxylate transporter receptor subunit TctC
MKLALFDETAFHQDHPKGTVSFNYLLMGDERYTLLVANVGALAVIPYATKGPGYGPRADIAPVCLAVDFSNVLVVHPGVPATTLAEYLALARRPEGMDYGTSGVGSAGHLAGELLKARSGARLNHVPFRGGGPAMNDLVASHVPSLIASAPTATGFMREGRIRALAATGAKRSPFDPTFRPSPSMGSPAMPPPTSMPSWCRRRLRPRSSPR